MAQCNGLPLSVYLRYRRIGTVIMSIIAALALAALSWADHHGYLLFTGSDWRRYHRRAFKVTAVIDGDTLQINIPDGNKPYTRVRLWGIDTPEIAKPHRDQPAQPFANQAKAYTTELTANQTVILTLQPHRLRGVFGRLIAYVTLPDGSTLNERLLAVGLARTDSRFSHEHDARYEMIQAQAQRDTKHLWHPPGTPQKTEHRF